VIAHVENVICSYQQRRFDLSATRSFKISEMRRKSFEKQKLHMKEALNLQSPGCNYKSLSSVCDEVMNFRVDLGGFVLGLDECVVDLLMER
jgi:hypothetical protein